MRVLMILSRDIPANPHSGRERTLASIREILASRHELQTVVLDSVVQAPRPMRVLGLLGKVLVDLLKGAGTPLQVALFHDRAARGRIFQAIDRFRPQVVYFDGIRLTDLLIDTRRRFPQLRLVCDFDDLMSLRFKMLLERELPISLGYLSRYVPRWVQGFIRRGFVTRAVLGYEAKALMRIESAAAQNADAVTVVSALDVAHLRDHIEPTLAARTHVIPPVVRFPRSGIRTIACREFLFVGTDALLQNQLTIRFLVDLWRSAMPSVPLLIVGRMTQAWPPCPGVRFTGFVDDISSIYTSECIALCPSFVQGGIKTKVLEALGQGVIPVGNELTFEGMGCEPEGLALTEAGIRELVTNPAVQLARLRESAERMYACVFQRYSLEAVAQAWESVVTPVKQGKQP